MSTGRISRSSQKTPGNSIVPVYWTHRTAVIFMWNAPRSPPPRVAVEHSAPSAMCHGRARAFGEEEYKPGIPKTGGAGFQPANARRLKTCATKKRANCVCPVCWHQVCGLCQAFVPGRTIQRKPRWQVDE